MPQLLPDSTLPSSSLEEVKTNRAPDAGFKCKDEYQNGTIKSKNSRNDINNGGGNHNHSNYSINSNSNNTIVGGLLSLANTAPNKSQVVAPVEKSRLSDKSQEEKSTVNISQSNKKNALNEGSDNLNSKIENRESNPSPDVHNIEGTTWNSQTNLNVKSSISTSEPRDGISNDGTSSVESKNIQGYNSNGASNGQAQKYDSSPNSSSQGQETPLTQVVQMQQPQAFQHPHVHDHQYHQPHLIKNQYIPQQHVPSHLNHYHQNVVVNSMQMHGHTPAMPPPHSQTVPYPNQNQSLPPQSAAISSPPRYQHRLHHPNHLHNKPHILHPGQVGVHVVYPNYPLPISRNVYQQVSHAQSTTQTAHPISQNSSPKESFYQGDQQKQSQSLPRSPQTQHQPIHNHSRASMQNAPFSSTESYSALSTSSGENVEESVKSKRSIPNSANSSSVERAQSPPKTSIVVASYDTNASPSKPTTPSFKKREITKIEDKPEGNPNKTIKLGSPIVSNPITPVPSRISNSTNHKHKQQYAMVDTPNGYVNGPYYPDPSKKPYPPPQDFSSPGHPQYPFQPVPIYANNHGPVYQQHSPATPNHSGSPFHNHHPGHGAGTSHVRPGHYGTNNEHYKHVSSAHPNVNFNQWHSYPTPPSHGQPSGLPPPQPHDHGPGHSVIVTPNHHVRARHPYQPQPQTPFTQMPKDGRKHDGKDAVQDYSLAPQQHLMPPPPTIHGEITSVAQWQQAQMITGFAPSANKCVPLKSPIPSKFWGDVEKTKDAYIPDFHRLVNFPDYLPKNRPPPADGMRCCVMCGKPRHCTASSSKNNSNSSNTNTRRHESKRDERNKKKDTPMGKDVSKSVGVKIQGKGENFPAHIIPRQNKGLCTACDVTVWVVTQSNLEIKWCKGCKNFRPWAAFGDKGLATKCVRCRDRQREKYALQKEDLKQKRLLTACPPAKKQQVENTNLEKNSDCVVEEKKIESLKDKEVTNREMAASGLSHLIAATTKIDC